MNYSVSKGGDDQLLMSEKMAVGASVSGTRKSYLEEWEESKRLEKQGAVVTHSQQTIKEMVEEDIALRLGKGALDVS